MSAAEERGLRRRVLVVDDDPEFVTFLATLLELEGIESTVATSAAAALEKLDHAVPNLVLLDIAMPDRDGLDLCRALKKDPRSGWQKTNPKKGRLRSLFYLGVLGVLGV